MNNTQAQRPSLKKQVSLEICGAETEGHLLENGQDKQDICKETEKNQTINGGQLTPPRAPGPYLPGMGSMTVFGSPPPVSPALDRWIRQRARDLTLRRVDTQRASKVVNNFRDGLVEFLKNNQEMPYFRQAKVLNSGSYFEMVKINRPNEFDLMLILPTPRLNMAELEEFPGMFYILSLCRQVRTNEIRSYLVKNQLTISAAKIRADMRDLVCEFISTYEAVPSVDSEWKLCAEDANSPAVTLELWRKDCAEADMSIDVVPALEVSSQGLPAAARAGPNVENWLGKKDRRKLISAGFYFVPKMPKGNNLSDMAKESWRISFSHSEKEIIRNHGNRRTCCEGQSNRCCRKTCLRLLKRLIEGLKQRYPEELDPLCSYHGKTIFFHVLSRRGDDSQWNVGDLSKCFLILLSAFEGHAHSGNLPHFFVPSHNLFAPPAFPQSTLDFLVGALREQRESNLPLLQTLPPAPLSSPLPSTSPEVVQTVGATLPSSPQLVALHPSEAYRDRSSMIITVVGVIVALLGVGLGFLKLI
ncbi:cyclic GMP-AMP synthase isoform X1 [Alosa alosa]|uniref:cyclic GMP-AMP synthase isoform X1 n=2 Tax=Alosa alosa TaxID=278164 RepID=UPI0020151CE0|nr:cyclic GMP-AMP synthase isoform X1 [Alosa alosa]